MDVISIEELLVTDVHVEEHPGRSLGQRLADPRGPRQVPGGKASGKLTVQIEELAEQAHKYDLTVAALQLSSSGPSVITTRRGPPAIDRTAYLSQVAELEQIGDLGESRRIENSLEALRTRMRSRTWAAEERRAVQTYRVPR